MGEERGKLVAGVVSKELLGLEEKQPSFLESNFLVCKKKEGETVRTKAKKKKKGGELPGEDESKQHTTAAVPASQVLGKVRDFLGVIAEANEKLQLCAQGNSRSEYDIEVLTGNESEYIEMDLLLGVTDLQTPDDAAMAEAAIVGSHQYLSLCDENCSSDSEKSSDEENDNTIADSSISHNKVPRPNLDDSSNATRSRKRPTIRMLD